MAEEKNIATGYIGNALRSTAADHTTTFTDEVFDTERQKYQNEVNTDLGQSIEAEKNRAEAAEEANAQAITDVDKIAKEAIDKISPLTLIEYGENKSTPIEIWQSGFYLQDGTIDSADSSNYLRTKVKISSNTKKIILYDSTVFSTGAVQIIFFDEENVISAITGTPGNIDKWEIAEIPANATHYGYNRRTSRNAHSQITHEGYYDVSSNNISDVSVDEASKYISMESVAFINNARIVSNTTPQIYTTSISSVSVFKVDADKKYKVQCKGQLDNDSQRFAALASNLITDYGSLQMIEKYDASGEPSDDGFVYTTIEITPSRAGYLYVMYKLGEVAQVEEYITGKGLVIKKQTIVGEHIRDNSITPSKLTDEAKFSSVLSGKKWAPFGDSFSYGSNSAQFTEGKYKGKNKVYPYFIGNRTNIIVLGDYFLSGRTLAYPEDGNFHNSICDPSQTFYFQNVPEDVDYITIYLGINDRHHAGKGDDGEVITGNIPLGTITDSTTATYYGAFNVVMKWLIENRPMAHIGIIVTNGVDEDYRQAQIQIAHKYGIPFIDMNGDDRTPFMIRSCNEDIDHDIREMRTRKQAVDYSGNNLHPNDAAHEYESYFIENFLSSL